MRERLDPEESKRIMHERRVALRREERAKQKENEVVKDPMLCDRDGQPLLEGHRVVLISDYEDAPENVGNRKGTVQTMHGPRSDWYGFPLIRFHGGTKRGHHVPNTAIRIVN